MADQELPCTVGTYTLQKVVGQGSYSKVYRALNAAGELVAVKQIANLEDKPKAEREAMYGEVTLLSVCSGVPRLSRVQAEADVVFSPAQNMITHARRAQSLSHPNIIQFYEWFTKGSDLYIAMEFAKLGDLATVIERASARNAPMNEKTVWKLFYQVSAGIRYLHEHRVIHRDIKPANVFVFPGGLIKLGDLGLGRTMDSSRAVTVVGTPYYMSPERIDEASYSFSADIWSLGCLLYELAALRSPFWQEGCHDLFSLITVISRCEYTPLPDTFSSALRDLVAACLVRDPTARPQASEVYEIARAEMTRFVPSESTTSEHA